MSITVTLNGNTSSLSCNFFPPIELPKRYVCGLTDLTTFNSIPNVDNSNNKFYIGEHVIEIPIGSYELEDIAEYLTTNLKALDEMAVLSIKANNNTLETEVLTNRLIDFTKPDNIGSILGFSGRELKPSLKKYVSHQAINITDVNSIRVECNLVTGAYINNKSVHTIHEFAPDVPAGYKIVEIPRHVIYFPVNTLQISNISVKLVNQDNKLINFRGEKITLRLHFKPEEQ